MKNITVLGSTGSIGVNTLRVIESNPDLYKAVALTAGRNTNLLAEQVNRLQPKLVAIPDEELLVSLKEKLKPGIKTEILYGAEGVNQAAAFDRSDLVVSAITGAAGLIPTYNAVKAGKDIALANKETMVMAGSIIMGLAKEKNVSILPVDSEHSAILQAMQGHSKEDIKKIILTASGGPFRDCSLEEMESLTPADALNHPNWDMGKKVTIDSSTLMNKGLEVIEAKWLFDLSIDQIDVVIHPESIVHSMVEYMDGSIIAQLGVPDMITPISYALSYPRHIKTVLPPLDIEKIGTLNFEKPDLQRFRSLAMALESVRVGETMPSVLNAANEIAVDAFLNEKISYLQIPELVKKTMNKHKPLLVKGIEDVLETDKWARETAKGFIGVLNGSNN